MNYNALPDIINILKQHNVSDVVLSPGSRSAPLTLSFARHNGFRKYIIPDERSAGYVALGIALAKNNPVILICTSGTAAINLSPAIAEAFYQRIPLIVLTADRPIEWIGQGDGQAIQQSGLYGKNIKWSSDVPVDLENPDSLWHAGRLISEAVIQSRVSPSGPVHLNFPFREPLYPDYLNESPISKSLKSISITQTKPEITEKEWLELKTAWNSSSKTLIIAGQDNYDHNLCNILNKAVTYFETPVLCDITANLNGMGYPFIYQYDLFINPGQRKCQEDLKADLVISFGNSILSKNLKKLVRGQNPSHHWHIDESGMVTDTFQSLTKILKISAGDFFDKILTKFNKTGNGSYAETWSEKERQANKIQKGFFPVNEFTELEAVKIIHGKIDFECNLHLANSLPVRLASYSGLRNSNIRVFSNRGTSGIDGCTSTAVGVSLTSDKTNILITGDMAFFYDRNALWHNQDISNLRIILLNNHGGGIFRSLDGPAGLPELEEYFETRQNLSAENTARDFNMEYFQANDKITLTMILPDFFRLKGSPAILEIQTDTKKNAKIFSLLKDEIQKIWN
jgi:2-succinyl-5-enolpyruvyl-6-hydroxy-3-cyclohexene-1-carboxylate synthase